MEKIPDHPPRREVEFVREPPLWLPSHDAIAFTVIAGKRISCTVKRSTLALLIGYPLEKPRNAMDVFYSLRLKIIEALGLYLNNSRLPAEENLEVTVEMLEAVGAVPSGQPPGGRGAGKSSKRFL